MLNSISTVCSSLRVQSKSLWRVRRKLAKETLNLLPNILFTENCLSASGIFVSPRENAVEREPGIQSEAQPCFHQEGLARSCAF